MFGLKIRHLPAGEAQDRAIRTRSGWARPGKRFLDQLSGSQRQRVAPACCSSAIDRSRCESIQIEIKRIQRATIVFVTHDQDEAWLCPKSFRLTQLLDMDRIHEANSASPHFPIRAKLGRLTHTWLLAYNSVRRRPLHRRSYALANGDEEGLIAWVRFDHHVATKLQRRSVGKYIPHDRRAIWHADEKAFPAAVVANREYAARRTRYRRYAAIDHFGTSQRRTWPMSLPTSPLIIWFCCKLFGYDRCGIELRYFPESQQCSRAAISTSP